MAGGVGNRGKGRPKGSVNKATLSIQDKLQRLGHDPIEGMAKIAMNELPCGVCRGTGKTLYRKPMKPRVKCDNCGYENPQAFVRCKVCESEPDLELAERICMSCYGTLMEACSPSLRGQMNAELAQYIAPKRKAIEVTGEEGGPLQHNLMVEFVKWTPPA